MFISPLGMYSWNVYSSRALALHGAGLVIWHTCHFPSLTRTDISITDNVSPNQISKHNQGLLYLCYTSRTTEFSVAEVVKRWSDGEKKKQKINTAKLTDMAAVQQ